MRWRWEQDQSIIIDEISYLWTWFCVNNQFYLYGLFFLSRINPVLYHTRDKVSTAMIEFTSLFVAFFLTSQKVNLCFTISAFLAIGESFYTKGRRCNGDLGWR